jgi:hypothetical protein
MSRHLADCFVRAVFSSNTMPDNYSVLIPMVFDAARVCAWKKGGYAAFDK